MKALFDMMPQTGKVEWIGIRRVKFEPLEVLPFVQVTTENGLDGDHYSGDSGKRQVTLIMAEHLEAVAKILNKSPLNPSLFRRNIVVSGINLLALKDRNFKIGEVVLQMTGICHPCSRMEENLGAGGYNAMRGHSGITAKVVSGGEIQIGDNVNLIIGDL